METNPMMAKEVRACAREQPVSLRDAPRCQGQNRARKSCRSAAVRGNRVCRFDGGRAGAPKGDANGAFKHGGWTDEAVVLRKAARRLVKRVRKPAPLDLDALRERRERRRAGEELPYTREEAQALISYCHKAIKEKAGSRAKRSAANKAAWAAGNRERWK